ncbi:MAG: hypothetical protein WCI42_00380 [Verrucomicrobiota bacterium]|jgi:hypothetical protein
MPLTSTGKAFLLVGLVSITACSNISEKRTLLASAGFQTIPATTPAQLAKLSSLKPGKVVPLNGKNGTVYVFADTSRKALLIGTPAQYQAYRGLKLKQKKIDEQLLDAQVNMDNSDWSAFGDQAGWGWGIASDPM